MTFKFHCPHCGQRIAATYTDVGTIGICQTCEQEFTVPDAPAPSPPDDIDEFFKRMDQDQPRAQHYLFAHQALPQVAFANPEHEVGCLHSPDARKLIQSLWDQVCARCTEPTDLVADQIKVHTCRAGIFPCVVVEMPMPLHDAEAYFVALIFRRYKMHGALITLSPALLYYTLEKGRGRDGSEATMLCEWTEKGRHNNFGFGPAPTLDDFINTVSEKALGAIR